MPAISMFVVATLPFIDLGSLASRQLPGMTVKKVYAVFMAMAGGWSLAYALYLF